MNTQVAKFLQRVRDGARRFEELQESRPKPFEPPQVHAELPDNVVPFRRSKE